MADLHLTDDDLESFFTKGRKSKRVVRHLLSGCGSCRQRAVETLEALGLDVGLLAEVSDESLMEAAERSVLIEEEKTRAKVSFARLAPLSASERLSAIRNHGRFKKYGLAVLLLDEADSLILKRNFTGAAELVGISVAVSDLLRPKIYGPGALYDLHLRQHTTLANIRRGEDDFVRALESLAEAEDVRHLSTDPVEETRFLRVKAALLYDLGEFEEAAEASDERAGLCELLGDLHTQGKALIQESMIRAQYDPDTGLLKADRGLSLINPAESFPLVCGVFNRAFCLIQLHRADEASSYLLSHREIIRKVVDPRREIHFLWLDAKIMWEERHYRDAEEMFKYVALRFADAGMNQEMLLVHIDRIELRLNTGRWKSALNLARHLTPELTKLGLRRDLLSMWATLQDGLLTRQITISEVRDFYRRRWNIAARLSALS